MPFVNLEDTVKLVNLTPHVIDIYGDETLTVSVPPSGQVARCKEERESTPPVEIGTMYIQTSRPTYGAVQGLPAPDGESIYLVSALVLAQCAGRNDVFAPGPAIRDDAGRIIGCAGLSAAPKRTPKVWDDRHDHTCVHGVDLSQECEECNRDWNPMLEAAWRAGANNSAPPDVQDARRHVAGAKVVEP